VYLSEDPLALKNISKNLPIQFITDQIPRLVTQQPSLETGTCLPTFQRSLLHPLSGRDGSVRDTGTGQSGKKHGRTLGKEVRIGGGPGSQQEKGEYHNLARRKRDNRRGRSYGNWSLLCFSTSLPQPYSVV
jgi:hypothetical protein